jgi:hypothetical protein
MNSERIATVRTAIGAKNIEVLTDVFRQSVGTPPGVQADRYRAKHPEWFDILDRLDSDQLFLSRQQRDAGRYQVRVFALPILSDEHAQELVRCMNSIYGQLKALYLERLSNPVTLPELWASLSVEAGSAEETVTKEALYYMTDAHGVWSGHSTGFPYVENGTISVSESVLRHENFNAVIDQFYDWHILNPQKRLAIPRNNVLNQLGSNVVPLFLGSATTSQPDWYEKLDSTKKALISELDTALESGLSALPTMGLRTLVESIMHDHVKPTGSFKGDLAAFSDAEFITKKHAALIESVVDAGHAAIHRAYFPNESDLQTCVETVKHLMHGVYILKPKVDAMAANTPKRRDGKEGGIE